jgi:hypothetical protein
MEVFAKYVPLQCLHLGHALVLGTHNPPRALPYYEAPIHMPLPKAIINQHPNYTQCKMDVCVDRKHFCVLFLSRD